MKNHLRNSIALSLLMMILLTANGQTEKGNLMVGADFSHLRFGLSRTYSQLSFDVAPSAGLFVANNLALGARLGVGYGSSNDRLNGNRLSGFSLRPSLFGRYYVPVSKRIQPFVELETGFGQGFASLHSPVNNQIFKPSWLFAQASAGVAFFIAPHASLDLSAGYRLNHLLNGPGQGHLGGSLQAKIGFNFYLPTAKPK